MPISRSNKPLVCITTGDPAGIGPEVTLKALSKRSIRRLAHFIVVSDAQVLKAASRILGIPTDLTEARHGIYRKETAGGKSRIFCLDLGNVKREGFAYGKEKAEYGRASVEYLHAARILLEKRIADCVVTAPINKSSTRKSGFPYPGQTEYFASFASKKIGYAMMLEGAPLRVSLVTRHIPIKDVPQKLSVKRIKDTIRVTLESLRTDFGIKKPSVAVLALNPHSGEGGIIGKEELTKISPALKEFPPTRVTGPIPADAAFYSAFKGEFDCLVCMYHDQALIPLKMIARDKGVNITCGLRIIRTSPDHGTAFEIAGKNKADSGSMEEAIAAAVRIFYNRKGS